MNKPVKNKDMPNVLGYLSPHQFLADYYKFRKMETPTFSYQTWADELGIKSRSYLRLIAMGRRSISAPTMQILLSHLDFDNLQKEYFFNMVNMTNAKSEEFRKKYSDAMLSLLRLSFDRFEVTEHFDFMSSLEIPCLQVLLSYDDIDRTKDELARMLGTSVENVERWLGILENLKMAECFFEGGVQKWRSTHTRFKVPPVSGSMALKHYHAMTLEKAQRSLDLSEEIRRFKTLLFPLNSVQFEEVWARLNEFAIALLKEYDGLPFSDRRLYQINFNVIPVSDAKSNSHLDTEATKS